MTAQPIQTWDLVILGFVLLSALWGLARGLVREVLGVAAWVGAAAATYYAYGLVRPFAEQLISMTAAADAVAAIGLFIVALILLSLLSSAISGSVRSGALSSVDRTLGFLFGVGRGGFLVCLIYAVFTWAEKPSAPPVDLAASRSWPLIAQGAGWIEGVAADASAGEPAMAAEHARLRAEQAREAAQALQNLNSPAPKPEPGRTGAGYNAGERRDLDRLIQGKQQF